MSNFTRSLQDLSSAQKSSKGVSLYSRYLNRPVGRVLAAGAYGLNRTPDQVTLFSAALTLTGVAVIAVVRPSPLVSILTWLCLALGFAFDSADGQLARLRGGGRPSGEWLDHIVDAGKMVAVHAAVLIMLFRAGDQVGGARLLVPLLYALVSTLMFAGGTLEELIRRAATAGRPPAPPAPPSTVRAIGLLPADYGLLCLVFLLTWWLPGFFVVYTLLLALNVLLLGALLVKWFRQLSRL